jgi:uncharacterized protein (DUF58 family)
VTGEGSSLFREWSSQIIALIVLATIVIVVSAISTVRALTAAVIFSLVFAAVLLYLDQPVEADVAIDLPEKAYVGDDVEVRVAVRVSKGLGMILFRFPAQERFELSSGTNVHGLFKGLDQAERKYAYVLKPLRRGSFQFSKVNYTYYPTLGALKQKSVTLPHVKEIEVLPRVKVLNKSQLKIRSTHFLPKSSRSRLGPYSTDFISVREYVTGDPYKFINWKASSRAADSQTLLVNDYEREGLRTFLFLLDRHEIMTRGTAEENPLEYGMAFVLSFSKLLLTSGFNVGLWTTPEGSSQSRSYVLPGSGNERFYRIKAALLETEPVQSENIPYSTSAGFRTIVRETVPSVIFVSSVSKENADELNSYLRALLSLGATVSLVDVLPYGIIERYSEQARSFRGMKPMFLPMKKKLYQESFPGSVAVIPWDPISDGVGKVVARLSSGITGGK